MRLSFFNGLILGTVLGVSALTAVSVSNEIVGSKGLKDVALIVPLSKAPDISVITPIVRSEVDRRPNIMLLASINARLPITIILDLSFTPKNE